MKSGFILLILFYAAQSFGANPVIYEFGELKVLFHQVDGVWVNKSCQNSTCLALKQMKEFKQIQIKSEDLLGGKNPHAVKCKQLMKGKVVIGLDKKKNQQSFCVFSDGSYLKS